MLAQKTCRFSAAALSGRIPEPRIISGVALFSCRFGAAESGRSTECVRKQKLRSAAIRSTQKN
jgi:hypothetical protein